MNMAQTENEAQGVVEIVGPDLDALLGFYLAIGFELELRTGDFAVVHWQGTRLFLAGNPDASVSECWPRPFNSLRAMACWFAAAIRWCRRMWSTA